MASCNVATILQSAYRAGYAKLSERDLQACVVAGACRSSVVACDAQSTLSLAYANGYAKLSERSVKESQTYSACAGPSTGLAQDLVNADAANRLASMSWRDLEAAQVASTCKASNPPCVTPTAPRITGILSFLNTSVTIGWKQISNSGSLITGYTVYWGTVSGVYTNNSGLLPYNPKLYVVQGLTPGTTYFFAIKAFAFTGCESAFSGEVSGTTTGSSTCAAGTAFAAAWAARVIVNGGILPSVATQQAIADFQCGLITDGLDTQMIAWNALVPDSLTAAITPQLVGVGLDPWTNIGPFVAGDLTVNGLVGNGTTKALDTGINPQGVFGAASPGTDCGLTFYCFTNNDLLNAVAMGCDNGGFGQFSIIGNNSTQSFAYAYDLASVAAANQTGFTGYNSGNRTAANALALYQANSGTAHHTLVSSAVGNLGAAAVPPYTIHVFCFANNTGNANFTNQRLSFSAIHHGLSSAQSALFFARIQTLRTSLGGGFI